MAGRKTDEERLQEMEKKIEEIKAKKQLVANRLKTKERKERTRRLIQVGAIFEKYLGFEGEEEAEQIAFGIKKAVEKNRENFKKIDVEKSKEKNEVVYKHPEETLVIPEQKDSLYESKHTISTK